MPILRALYRSHTTANYDMRVQCGLAMIQGEVACHCRHLDLLVDGVLAIHLLLRVEPPQNHAAEGSDSSEVRGDHVILFCEIQKPVIRFIAPAENNRVLLGSFTAADQLYLHAWRGTFPLPGFSR